MTVRCVAGDQQAKAAEIKRKIHEIKKAKVAVKRETKKLATVDKRIQETETDIAEQEARVALAPDGLGTEPAVNTAIARLESGAETGGRLPPRTHARASL